MKKFADSELGGALGLAAVILAVLLGIGACNLLTGIGASKNHPAAQPTSNL